VKDNRWALLVLVLAVALLGGMAWQLRADLAEFDAPNVGDVP
jgi:hypothetical protein